MNGLDIRPEDFVTVPAYGTSKEITSFQKSLGDKHQRIIQGGVEYYSFKHYEMLLAGISSMESSTEYTDDKVVADLEELLNSPIEELTPPKNIDMHKQEKGIVLIFKNGNPLKFVSGELYRNALKIFNELKSQRGVQKIPEEDATEDAYFAHLGCQDESGSTPSQESNGFSGSDSRYSKMIDAISYLMKEYVYDRWMEQFNQQREQNIGKDVRKKLKGRFYEKTKGRMGGPDDLERYIASYYNTEFSTAIGTPADQKSIDDFMVKRSRSSQPVTMIYNIIGDHTPVNREKGDILREFFTAFFNHIRQSMSTTHYSSVNGEIEALGNKEDVKDFFEFMYHVTKDRIGMNLSQRNLSRAVKELDYMPLTGLNGEDITMLMRELRKRAEKIRSHDTLC